MARGFQEQSDSPTILRASVKTFVAVAANEGFEICSMDITGAFLQAEDLDREVFVKPPKCPIGYLSLQIKTKKGECITNFIENVQLYINIVLYF